MIFDVSKSDVESVTDNLKTKYTVNLNIYLERVYLHDANLFQDETKVFC